MKLTMSAFAKHKQQVKDNSAVVSVHTSLVNAFFLYLAHTHAALHSHNLI